MPDRVLQQRRAIGERVRAERTRQKLTQERLAEIADLDRKTVNRIEQGTHATLVDHLLLIADALDVPPATFMAGGGPAAATGDVGGGP